jgi:hypothetical protein
VVEVSGLRFAVDLCLAEFVEDDEVNVRFLML